MGFSDDNILNWLIVDSIVVMAKYKKSKTHHKYKHWDGSQLDEQDIHDEAQKLLNEIRAEIRYAESCLDFGEYCMQLNYWNDSEGVVHETIYENDESARHEKRETRNEKPADLKQGTKESVRQSSISSASSEPSIDGKRTSRVEAWAQSLENLLSDPVGLKCFQEFLKKEFSEENLLFWVACERFKKMKDIAQMRIMAHEISRNYLSGNAAFLVNVDSVAVKKTESELNTPHPGMFNVPQQQVFQLMKFDGYNRFLKSSLYQDCLVAEKNDRLYPYEDEMMDNEVQKTSLWTKSLRSPVSDSGEKRRKPLNFLIKGKHVTSPDCEKTRKGGSVTSPDHEKRLQKERSSSLGAYDETKNQVRNGSMSKSKIVRVFLPDGSSSFIVGEVGQTLRDGLKDLGEKKNLQLQTLDVTLGYDKKVANLDLDISNLEESVVYLEKRVLLRFDLPNGRSVGVKANPNKTLRDVLRPVMKTNGFELEKYSLFLVNTKSALSLDSCVSEVENKRIVTKLNHRRFEKQNSDSAVGRMGPHGFRASFRKFRTSSTSFVEGKNDKTRNDKFETRKVSRKKSDDEATALMTVLQKSQNSRLDDQRGLISHDIEMPDFLKVTSSTPSPVRNTIVNKTTNTFQNTSTTPHPSPLDLCSVRSWKELSSPDRRLVDRSYTFDNSCSMDRTCTSTNSIDTFSVPSITKAGLLFSKSDSSLLMSDSLINISAEANHSAETSQKHMWSGKGRAASTLSCRLPTTITDNHNDNYRKGKENNYDYSISTPEKKKSSDLNEISRNKQDSGIDTNPSNSENNLNNINTNNESKDGSTESSPKKNGFAMDGSKSESTEILGSINIIEYDLSPRAVERCKKLSLADDGLLHDVDLDIFEGNAVPTPEKGKLLKGETVRGRQNEKITFV